MKKIALTFYSVLKMPIDDIIECSIAAQEAGFGYVTFAESFYRDGFSLASAVAARTSSISLGTSVMPVYTRTPFQLAMGTATLHEISDGRIAFLGLGVGYRERTEQYFGIKQERRVERMQEYVTVIRRLLAGDESSYAGNFFNFKGFPKLSGQPLNIPIFFGSSAPRMLELSGQISDGVILNSISTPEYMKFALDRISEGAKTAGRDPRKIEIAHSIIFALSEDVEAAAAAAREDILFYLAYPELDPVIKRSQFREESIKIRDLYAKGKKKKALSLINQEMLDTFAVYGTPEDCLSKLRNFVQRGITLPIIRVSVTPYDEKQRKDIFLRTIRSLENY